MHHDADINKFYRTKRWEHTRKAYLVEIGGLCERCLEKGLIEPATQVHHKIRLTSDNLKDPNISIGFQNLEGLCERCHREEHVTKRWRCDETGRVML